MGEKARDFLRSEGEREAGKGCGVVGFHVVTWLVSGNNHSDGAARCGPQRRRHQARWGQTLAGPGWRGDDVTDEVDGGHTGGVYAPCTAIDDGMWVAV